jgi:DNA-binding MarR family transcriptional regulator
MMKKHTPSRPADARFETDPRLHSGVFELLEGNGFSPETINALLQFDVAVFQWKRMGEREEFRGKVIEQLEEKLEPALLQGLISVARIQGGFGQCDACAPTIGLVAQELALDPSRASRIISDLVARGYVERKVAQEDARRSVLDLTPKAHAFLTQFMHAKWQIVQQVFAGWSDEDMQTFSKLFTKFVASSAQVISQSE